MIAGRCAVCGDPVDRISPSGALRHAGPEPWGHAVELDRSRRVRVARIGHVAHLADVDGPPSVGEVLRNVRTLCKRTLPDASVVKAARSTCAACRTVDDA